MSDAVIGTRRQRMMEGEPEQLPLLEAQMMAALCAKPDRLEMYCVLGWHGVNQYWKLFPETFSQRDKATDPLEAAHAAERWAHKLPGCWTHLRIMRMVIE